MHQPHGRPEDALPVGSRSGDGAAHGSVELAHWRALIAGDELDEIVGRLDEDELVALERRTKERMAAAAVLLELERLIMAAAARLVYHAAEFDGSEPLAHWIEARIDQAIEDCVSEDAIEERDRLPATDDDPRYARLATELRTDARTFRRGAVVFHRMPHQDRAAFWAVFVLGQSLEQHAADMRIAVRVARRRFDRAVRTLCTLGASLRADDLRDEQGGLQ